MVIVALCFLFCKLFLCFFQFLISSWRSVDHQGNKNQYSRGGEARRVCHHDRVESPVLLKYGIDPDDPHAAYSQDRKDGGNRGDAEASQISGHHLVYHAEQVSNEDQHQTGITQFDDLRITVKQGQQKPSAA